MIITNLLIILKKKILSVNLKKCPENEDIERTKEIINLFNIKDGVELTKLYCKSDVILLADVIEKFVKVSYGEYGINPLYCVVYLFTLINML